MGESLRMSETYAKPSHLGFIGYWLAIYEAVALMEHFVFKKGFSVCIIASKVLDGHDAASLGILKTFSRSCANFPGRDITQQITITPRNYHRALQQLPRSQLASLAL